MDYIVETATSGVLLDHAERFMAEAGYSSQARSENSITFSGREGMSGGMQALTLGISLFDPNFAAQTLTAHNTGRGATESTTLVARASETRGTAVTVPDDAQQANNLLRFWVVADVLRQPLPEPMMKFRDTKPLRGYIGLQIFNDRVEWHEGTFRLKRKGEPMPVEAIRAVKTEGKRLNHRVIVEGEDGRVFAMGHLTNEQAQGAKTLVEQRMAVHAADPSRFSAGHTGASTGTPPEAKSGDVIGQIERLAALREAGVLTEEEFAEKKSELLRRL